jgi:2-polyprenyl-6-methoxyphenol hydroxylase-like FAD-dependent oxidoreductase
MMPIVLRWSISATHVIGADGIWSKVRQSFPSFNSQATMVTCPSFGVHMNSPSIPETRMENKRNLCN